MLRLIVNRAKNHYNQALEHAERGRLIEAISELDSALQLDNTFTEARLLLGTLYARLERPEEARTQWDEVLASDISLRRAHEYLGAIGALKRTLPLARRVRAALVAAGMIMAFAVAIVAISLWPSREERLLDEAWRQFADRNFVESDRLISIMARPLSNDDLESSALLLESSIQQAIDERLQLVTHNLAQGHYDGAMDVIAEIESLSPPPSVMHTISNYRSLIRAALEEQVASAAEADFSAENLDQLEQYADELKVMFPASEVGEKALRSFTEKGRRRFRAMLEKIDEELAAQSAPSVIQLLLEDTRALAMLLDQEGELQTRQQLISRLEQRLSYESAVEEAEAGRDEQALAMLSQFDAGAATEEIARKALQLKAQLKEQVRKQRIERLWAAIDSEDYSEAMKLAQSIDLEGLDEASQAALEERMGEVERRFALSAYYELMKHADQFEAGTIDEATARDALEKIDQIDGHLPASVKAAAWDDLYFFRAVAHRVLGQTNESNDAIESLRSEYPNSPYLLVWERVVAAN